jgi:virginiamycin A acetyltransferase
MKPLLKAVLRGVSLVLVLPLAIVACFGRLRAGFVFGSHAAALLPGLPGDYLRTAYYRLTLDSFHREARVSFGTIFSTPAAMVGSHVYIGSYCVIGRARIGDHAQIASHVQILSGARQHQRDETGRISGSEAGIFQEISIGAHAWIGAAAILMADAGESTTIGAGSVVTKPIPGGVVAVGNPARVLDPDTRSVTSAKI